MRRPGVVGQGLIATLGLASMAAATVDLFPDPVGPLVFGAGLGLFAVAMPALKKGLLTKPIADPKLLPKVSGQRTSRRRVGRSSDVQELLERYDDAFSSLKAMTEPAQRISAFERLKPIVFELAPEVQAWRGEARLRIFLLLKEIAKDFDSSEVSNASAGLLVLILSKGGPAAAELARPLFYDKVSLMYDDPHFKEAKFLPRLLLLLDNFAEERTQTMAIDAIHLWDDGKFKASGDYLGLESIPDLQAQTKLKELLGKEISKAQRGNDPSALARASELYSQFA